MSLSIDKSLSKAAKLARAGDLQAASDIYRDVLEAFPANRRARQELDALNARRPKEMPPRADYDRLVAMYQRGMLRETLQAATAMAARYPSAFIIHNVLGLTQAGLQNWTAAITSYERALSLNPRAPEILTNLGIALEKTGNISGAIDAHRRALAISPGFLDAFNNLGLALARAGQHDEAVGALEKARQLQPDAADTRRNLIGVLEEHGACLMQLGQAAAASKVFARAIELGSDKAATMLAYVQATKIAPNDPFLARMRSLAADGKQDEDSAILLHFALAKAGFDISDDEHAFEHLIAGNGLRKSQIGYSFDTDRQRFEDIRTYFEITAPSQPTYTDELGFTPVFIVGMPRSGTTLVEQILASHSQCFGAGELSDLATIAAETPWYTDERQVETFRAIRREYAKAVRSLTDKPFVTDKMPLNFRLIGFIANAFPEARIVHLRRSAEAVCWSNFRRPFTARGMGFACDMEDIARYHGLYADLMAFWRDRYANAIYDLDYEALTEKPEEVIRQLLSHVGLSWDSGVLDFHKSARIVLTASALQVRQEIYKGSSEEWRPYAEFLAPMLKILNGRPAPSTTPQEKQRP
ncbi:sulfotransferase [Rhizobium sp. PAMB 3174]